MERQYLSRYLNSVEKLLLREKKFTEIRQWAAELWPKITFITADVCQLEFQWSNNGLFEKPM